MFFKVISFRPSSGISIVCPVTDQTALVQDLIDSNPTLFTLPTSDSNHANVNIGVHIVFEKDIDMECLKKHLNFTLNTLYQHLPELRSGFVNTNRKNKKGHPIKEQVFYTVGKCPEIHDRPMRVNELVMGEEPTPLFAGLFRDSTDGKQHLQLEMHHAWEDGNNGFSLCGILLQAIELYAYEKHVQNSSVKGVFQNAALTAIDWWAPGQMIEAKKSDFVRKYPPRVFTTKDNVVAQFAETQSKIRNSSTFSEALHSNYKPIIDTGIAPSSHIDQATVTRLNGADIPTETQKDGSTCFVIPKEMIERIARKHCLDQGIDITDSEKGIKNLQNMVNRVVTENAKAAALRFYNNHTLISRTPRAITLKGPDGKPHYGYHAVSWLETASAPQDGSPLTFQTSCAQSYKHREQVLSKSYNFDGSTHKITDFVPGERIIEAYFEGSDPTPIIPLQVNYLPGSMSQKFKAMESVVGPIEYSYHVGAWPRSDLYNIGISIDIGQNDKLDYTFSINVHESLGLDKTKVSKAVLAIFMDILNAQDKNPKTNILDVPLTGTGFSELQSTIAHDKLVSDQKTLLRSFMLLALGGMAVHVLSSKQ